MSIRRAPWAWVLAVGGILTGIEMLLPDGGRRDALFLVIAVGCALALALGARSQRPDGLVGWYLVALGQIVWITGGTLVTNHGGILPDMLVLLAYPIAAAGVEVLTRSRRSARDLIVALDSAILTVAATMVAWVFLIAPAWSSTEGATRLLAIGQPIASLVFFAALVRFAYAPGAARGTRVALLVGLGALMAYQSAARGPSTLTIDGPGARLADAWLLALLAGAVVTNHPRIYRLSAAVPLHRSHSSAAQLLGLAAALVVGPAAFASQILAHRATVLWPAPLFYLTLVALVMTRILVMVRAADTQAISDDLTGLPNRRALHRRSRALLADPEMPQALLLLDLDRFKEVNDSLGHHAGDELLVQVATRLKERLRSDDLLVRLGGDEFAILLDGAGTVEAEQIVLGLIAGMAEAFDLGELTVHSSASIGIALFPDHGTDLSTLMRKADVAMYRAKATGGYRMHGGGDEGVERLRLSEEFRTALTEDQLVLHYQPKLDLDTGQARGVEALVRWQHPERGLLQPADFLERVEEAGLMGAMTQVVLSKALDQAATWRAAGRDLTVAVNLSASSLVDMELPARITAMLTSRGLPSSVLHLEITEEFLMADRARARAILTALRDAGITIAVDDFGTGYSSLSYLRDLPIDELKLDGSFVLPMSGDPRAAALVSSTIGLAHSLGLRMVAEGVEDDAAYDELTRLGCDQAQGFYMTRPLPAGQLETWFDDRVRSGEVARPPR